MRYSFVSLRLVAVLGLFLVGLYGILHGVMLGWIPVVISGLMLGLYANQKDGNSAFGRSEADDVVERAKILGVSEEEIRLHDEKVKRDTEITIELVENFELPSGRAEPLPPWIEEPGAGPYHMIWRMGAEGYLRDEFSPFFNKLDRRQKEEYFARYDLGEGWPDRETWYNGLLRSLDGDIADSVS